jgi:hypothetical protein
VGGIELRRVLDADLSRDRAHAFVEAVHRVFGVEDVEDQETGFGV